MSEKIYVFGAKYPFDTMGERVFPAERAEEISSVKNERVRAEKYYVWKLLERALREVFGLEMEGLRITREKSGKWRAEGVEFSLSHSRGVAAVALARVPVGVDIEVLDAERFSRLSAEKIQTGGEIARGEGADAMKKCALWTKKEAIFKCMGGSVFRPEKIESDALPTKTVKLTSGGESFFLTVAAGDAGDISFDLSGLALA